MNDSTPWLSIVLILGALAATAALLWVMKAAALKASREGAGRKPSSTEGQTEGADRDPAHGVSLIEDPNPHGYNDEPRDHQAR